MRASNLTSRSLREAQATAPKKTPAFPQSVKQVAVGLAATAALIVTDAPALAAEPDYALGETVFNNNCGGYALGTKMS
jgi:hypothetical protein